MEANTLKSFKKPYERAVRKSVSMPEFLFDQADGRRRANQITTFSDYLQGLIRKDLDEAKKAA